MLRRAFPARPRSVMFVTNDDDGTIIRDDVNIDKLHVVLYDVLLLDIRLEVLRNKALNMVKEIILYFYTRCDNIVANVAMLLYCSFLGVWVVLCVVFVEKVNKYCR